MKNARFTLNDVRQPPIATLASYCISPHRKESVVNRRHLLKTVGLATMGAIVGQSCASRMAAPPTSRRRLAKVNVSIVRQVDHVLIAAHSGPELLELFAGKLQLHKPWPFAVSAGNATLELSPYDSVSPEHPQRAESRDLPWPGEGSSEESARIVGLALEPFPLEAALAEMDRRAIRYREPSRQYEPGNDDNLWWTIVSLPDLSVGLWVFLCELSPSTFEQWAARASANRGHHGGPLGVIGVSEIAVGVVDYEASLARWGTILGPVSPSGPGVWRPGDGPTIRLVADRAPGVQRLTFAVASLDTARRFLLAEGMLGEDGGSELTMARSSVLGLDLRLIQS